MPMKQQSASGTSPTERDSRPPPAQRRIIEGTYECWSNEVSPSRSDSVYRENKAKYRNVQVGPVISADEVDALLCRKPNAVKNFINSLNEQMRQRLSPAVAADINTPLESCDYEPEFGRELQQCNVSVKNRITIFDRKTQQADGGARLKTAALRSEGFVNHEASPGERSMATYATEVGTLVAEAAPKCSMFVSSTPYDSSSWFGLSSGFSQYAGEELGPPSRFGANLDLDRIAQLSQVGFNFGPPPPSTERSLTDVVRRVGAPCNQFGPSLQRCMSDHSHEPERDPFGSARLGRKAINKGPNAARYRFPGEGSPEPRGFGLVDTDDTLSFHESRNAWAPSLGQRRTFADAPVERVELPLELVRRGYDTDSDCSGPYADSADLESRNSSRDVAPYFTIRASGREIRIHTTNVIKAGWTWMHSARARKWFPKYLVLFYDEPQRARSYQLHATINGAATGGDRGAASPSSFWDIYKIYSHLGQTTRVTADSADRCKDLDPSPRLPPYKGVQPESLSISGSYSRPRNVWDADCKEALSVLSRSTYHSYLESLDAVGKSLSSNQRRSIVIIPDNATVYLTILSGETDDVAGALRRGDFREFMEVDVGLVPYTKQHAPNHWLTGFLTRTMGRDPLNLIHIPLVDGYECCFMPLCAAHFSGVSLTYEMECARLNRVGREYEHWLFSLWEFVVRRGGKAVDSSTDSGQSIMPVTVATALGRLLRSATEFLSNIWQRARGTNKVSAGCDEASYTHELHASSDLPEEQESLKSVLSGGGYTRRDVGSPSHKRALTRGFAQWISSRGFDDLSVSMNIYSLTSRFGEL
ncbi:glycoside hydrolase family 2, putative [Babesia ovata]|uniref:Glycoside hydrolase family 2, putative n=1 Tax=Babesia ovata TaxID=189622 RepID=A0A2H6KE94_9APIC|nr:glycoside hydrolase family 2, putative [Babesia ovata]GBE61313.1 glycoside hydrolase family 2, putative [Babesia ovata]